MKSQTEIVTKEKRANSLPYFLPYIIFILNYYSPIKGGWFSYSVPLLAFGLIPLLDLWIGLDDWNPSPELARQLDKKISFRIVTWLWLPCQLFILVWTTNYICTHSLPISDLIGVTLGVGIVGGLGINCAHELIHKPNTFEQMLGKLLLVSVSYGHFYVEHLFGHHKRVSTIEDPATSRFGESFYSFWIRSVVGSFKSAWEIEKKRIESEGLPVFSIYNQVIQFTGTSFFLAYLFFLKFGICGFIFFVAQSILAFTLLEAVNYIEHYGLERKRLESGEFSRVTPAHSWSKLLFSLKDFFLKPLYFILFRCWT